MQPQPQSDSQYRRNVAMLVLDSRNRVLWCKRIVGEDWWQVPQGGVDAHESPQQAMQRELYEEVGLTMDAVQVLGHTCNWYKYDFPPGRRPESIPEHFVGQQQRWYALRLLHDETSIVFDRSQQAPEFEQCKWVSYWYPVQAAPDFKRDTYRGALLELKDKVFGLRRD